MSTIEFTLPELGEDVEAGTVVKLLVAEGDALEAEQPVMEVEIDKATVELPAPQAGTVEKLAVGEGDEVKVGQLVMLIATNGAAPAKSAPAKSEPAESEPAKSEPAESEPA
ncbi:MAG TPA: hypothetical protein DEA08_07025, partial [Planctomycetes bacterium]|nr:hypothetical protein [Planctomycetota bacterium]